MAQNICFLFVSLVSSILMGHLGFTNGITREYFVAIEEIEWDYAPSGMNLMKNIPLEEDEDASVFTSQGDTTIGRKYKKAVFRQYTDNSYTQQTARPTHLGILGPPLKAEVGDIMIIHVNNTATRVYGMHPHGVFYNKSHEGALYHDKTSNQKKIDDMIEPGTVYTYQWDVVPSFGPTDDDPNCLSWAYHSHTNAPKDTNTGLVGPLIVCRPGTLDESGQRTDVEKEWYIFVTVFDENESWYLQDNIEEYCEDPEVVDTDDEDFQESNKMHGINGFVYGNLKGLEACERDRVAIYLLGLGTEVDIHSIRIHGQTFVIGKHRQSTVNIFPGVFTTAMLHADNPGKFDLGCTVNDHLSAGMITTFTISNECVSTLQKITPIIPEVTRHFYIGIVEEEWDYGPSGMNLILNESLLEDGSSSATFFEKGPERIGGVYKKAIFYEYTSPTFTERKEKPASHGVLGPQIAVEVGDTARITLKNFATNRAYNIEPQGVFYQHTSRVEAGETHTFKWTVPESVSPTETDSDCIVYVYASAVDPIKDTNSGLVGPLMVCKKGTLDEYLERPALYFLMTVFDENSSHYIDENILGLSDVDKEDDDFKESNLMHSINGRMYGNLPVEFCRYMESDIHVLAVGNEVDMHSFYVEGIAYKYRNEFTNVLNVFPHTTASATIKPTKPDHGLIFCDVYDHVLGGMATRYQLTDCAKQPDQRDDTKQEAYTRTYYIAVKEEVWDYCPWKQETMDHDLTAFTKQEDGKFIGSKYWKAIYHQYTNESFAERIQKPEHFAMLGPIISAEEGETIKIIFKNFASRPYNIMPNGLSIVEGASYEGATEAAPGETITYTWEIPDEIVPSTGQPGCISGLYQSNVDKVKDVYSGLAGPLRICRKGELEDDDTMFGMDEEFYLLILVFDESNSHYIDKNIREFANANPQDLNKEDDGFLESNLMHSINGRIGFLDGLEMFDGDRVVWHLLGLGNEVDLHNIHFHAHAFEYTTEHMTHSDVFNLFPGKVGTVVMAVNAVGSWLLHCHVNDHITGGMNTVYTVYPKSERTLHERPCSATQRSKGKYNVKCLFKTPRQLQNLLERGIQEYGVCLNHSRSSEQTIKCQNVSEITADSVRMLNVSTTFHMDSESFRNLMRNYRKLRSVIANNIGLSSLLDDTFLTNQKLIRIELKGNRLDDFTLDPFSSLPSLKRVRLQDTGIKRASLKEMARQAGISSQVNFFS